MFVFGQLALALKAKIQVLGLGIGPWFQVLVIKKKSFGYFIC